MSQLFSAPQKSSRIGKLVFVGVAVLIASEGCSRWTPSATTAGPSAVDTQLLVENAKPSEQQVQQMMSAKDALFSALSGRLMEAMGQVGPDGAIEVCHTEANEIASRIGQEQGMRIGRTGVRLRNPQNTPPDWARELTGAKQSEPVFGLLSDQTPVALLPIKLQPQCLMCHGPKEQIAPPIADKLAQLYPKDAATGFQEGELRGWFWIEMTGAAAN